MGTFKKLGDSSRPSHECLEIGVLLMKVLVTGANGFLARNLISHLNFRADIEVIPYTRQNQISELKDMLVGVETIFHLAGANRPSDQKQFELDNEDLTRNLCDEVRQHAFHHNYKITIIFVIYKGG